MVMDYAAPPQQPFIGGFEIPEPAPISDEVEYWSDDPPKYYDKKKPNDLPQGAMVRQDGMIIYAQDPASPGGIFGMGIAGIGAKGSIHYKQVTFEDGAIVARADGGIEEVIDTDPAMAKAWNRKITIAKSEYDQAARTVGQKPTTFQQEGITYQLEPETYPAGGVGPVKPAGARQLVPTSPEAQRAKQLDLQSAEQQLAQQQQQFSQQKQIGPLQLQKAQLDLKKTQQELLDPYTNIMQQQSAAIDVIRDQMSRGEVSLAEGNNLMSLVRANSDATLKGTTLWQMMKDEQDRKEKARTERFDIAGDLMKNQMGYGSSLASGLLSGLGSIYSNILSSSNPPTGFNPLEMAKTFMDEMSGGLSATAQDVLREAMAGNSQAGIGAGLPSAVGQQQMPEQVTSRGGARPMAADMSARQPGEINPAAMVGGGLDQLQDYRAYASQVASKLGLNPEVFLRQIEQESGFDPNTPDSIAGAQGIAQIIPKWHPNANTRDPYASMDYAANLMKQYMDQYGDIRTALAAYNAGPGAVEQYGGVPPYEETLRYLQKILGGMYPGR